MSVPPQDSIPQRQLVFQLALAIDRAIVMAGAGGDAEKATFLILSRLIDTNPRSAYSTHVLHNIGKRRARWLVAYRDRRPRGAFATSI